MNPIQELHALGQSIWLDYIRRDLLESGELARMIAAGQVRGVTSNPTIFEQAIAGSDLYAGSLRPLAQAGWDAERIFDALAVEDIRAATEIFLPLYEESQGGDGYVSIEVNPKLANDTQRTLDEARRLWSLVNRPNVMIKIPATLAGIPAIEQAITEGINVNVTLIFSLDRYAAVMDAYLKGLEARAQAGQALDHVASVASFFVSRVDTKVDGQLQELIAEGGPRAERAQALLGKIAIANAKLAYAQFKAVFGAPRFQALQRKGARVQRPLWASTSTKNPAYPDTYYVDNLIGPDTVNTVPPKTLDLFRAHGRAALTLEQDLSAARAQLQALEALGIAMERVTDELEQEGVEKFAHSFVSLLRTLEKQARLMRKEMGPLMEPLRGQLEAMASGDVGSRLWRKDATLWVRDAQSSEGREVQQRLGWLTLPQEGREHAAEFEAFAEELQAEGIEKVLWLGMGGSSLAADVFSRTAPEGPGLSFEVLDSTDPAAVRRAARRSPAARTLFAVASKSGTTTEPLALLEFFWERARRRLGAETGRHFIAVTDPGTPLQDLASERGFRRVFTAPPEVGGRYSALSVFGMLPAALMGLPAQEMLEAGARMARACGPKVDPARNPGLFLGAILAAA